MEIKIDATEGRLSINISGNSLKRLYYFEMLNTGHSDETLIKSTGTDATCVVFAGNGAIENGWSPLRKVLDTQLKSDTLVDKSVTNLRTRNEEAFHQLAIL